jgi:hypothetical protein
MLRIGKVQLRGVRQKEKGNKMQLTKGNIPKKKWNIKEIAQFSRSPIIAERINL